MVFKIIMDSWKSKERPFFECECGDHAFVALSGHGVALVDLEDVSRVSHSSWASTSVFGTRNVSYAVSTQRGTRSKQKLMHRIIMGNPKDLVDHINHNGLDNRKINLRNATTVQNLANRRPVRGSASRFKGVSRSGNKWGAWIKVNGKNRYLGRFETEEDAALAYNFEAYFAWGDNAYMNKSSL